MRTQTCVAIPRLEALLDAFARGGSTDLEELEQFQAHFLTCWYCGELMRTAEDLRLATTGKTSRSRE
jgi:hypothetical protein